MSERLRQLDPAAHKVADVLLPWFVNGTLNEDELAFVGKHVAACASCQREVEWLRELHAACVAGAQEPSLSNAFQHLRRQLDRPSPPLGAVAWLRGQWARVAAAPRWAMAVQLAVIVALGAALLGDHDGAAGYKTLGASNAATPVTGSLVAVFDPATTESDLRRILRRIGARVVDGPTQANAYVLDVPSAGRDRALAALRSERAVRLVERLDSGSDR